ncbi:MAG: mechanosensitive ion channel family protein [Acidimicrobiia bacterium]
MIFLFAQTSSGSAGPCGPPEEASWLCELVYSSTGKPGFARAADVLIARPLTVLLILLVAWVGHRLARRGIRRLVRRVHNDDAANVLTTTRRAQRAEALGTLLSSVAGAVIWTVAGLMVLDELGLNLGPFLAGAGVVGVAVGFGSQALVRDFLSGIFMLVEDQYGVGDVIDTGQATGRVESVSLRSTRLRSVDGIMWHVPNGEIRRVGNTSQQWSRALLDVPVPYDADPVVAMDTIRRVAEGMAAEPEWAPRILGRPEVWGVERFDATSLAVRTVVTTRPREQWPVSRELRLRIKLAFDQAGIDMGPPTPMVWLPSEQAVSNQPR